MPLRHTIPLLGSSLLILSACATTSTAPVPPSPSSTSTKEKAVNTAAETQPPKRSLDGSAPFTMPEIEERLLKVLALPPVQINKEGVEKAFEVELEGEDNTFYENTSDLPPTAFLLEVLTPRPAGRIFEYNMFLRRKNEEGKEILIETPREIPEAYKFPYLPFVQKLASFGWQHKGLNSDVGNHSSYFMKDGFLLVVHIDNYQYGANSQPDHAQTRISRIVVDVPLNQR